MKDSKELIAEIANQEACMARQENSPVKARSLVPILSLVRQLAEAVAEMQEQDDPSRRKPTGSH